MNLSTSLRPGNGTRSGPAQVDQRGTRPRHDPRPPRADHSCARRPVAPVMFLEPGPPRATPATQRRRADQDEETLRPLRTPFTADGPGGP